MITLIYAVSENNVIGKDNKMPWPRIGKDLGRFEKLTLNHPIIMGRKTKDSIPSDFMPLHDRKNIVMSKNMEPSEGIYVARNIDEALKLTGGEDSYVMGGAKIYKQFLDLGIVDKIELTKIHKSFEGDTFFPKIDLENDWKMIEEPEYSLTKKGLCFSFWTYEKKQ